MNARAGQILCVPTINFIENEILVTTYEYEDYGSYDFLVIDNEILNDLERLKEYVEHLLFS